MGARREGLVGLATGACLTVIVGLALAQTPQDAGPGGADPNAGRHLDDRARQDAFHREFERRVAEQQERMRRDMARQIEQVHKQRDREHARAVEAAERESIGATYAQWRTIKPRFQALKDLMEQSYAMIRPQMSYSKGSTVRTGTTEYQRPPACKWRWDRPSEDKAWEELGPAERTCEELLDLLTDETTPLEQIWEKVELLRRQKHEAAELVQEAREELREVVNPRQEAALTVKGYLR
jgi:hypothetical protein